MSTWRRTWGCVAKRVCYVLSYSVGLQIFDFELPSEDMRAIDALDEQDRYYWTGKGVE